MNLSNAEWAAIAVGAVKTAFDTARALGYTPPGEHELEELNNALNEQAAKMLPGELTLLAIAVNAAAVRSAAKIASLGTVARCPRCSGVLTIHAEVTPGGGDSSQTTSCSSCGWKSTNP